MWMGRVGTSNLKCLFIESDYEHIICINSDAIVFMNGNEAEQTCTALTVNLYLLDDNSRNRLTLINVASKFTFRPRKLQYIIGGNNYRNGNRRRNE